MKYQLVIQFSQELEGGFDRLINIEDELDKNLSINAEVDGHDFGSGQMNIFILTDEPLETFEQIKKILIRNNNLLNEAKMAYRDIQKNNFIILWPKDLKEFEVI